MAFHETQDSKVFQKFKKRIANEPQQVSYKVLVGKANAGHGFCVVQQLCDLYMYF